jgi:hypothetical protein
VGGGHVVDGSMKWKSAGFGEKYKYEQFAFVYLILVKAHPVGQAS